MMMMMMMNMDAKDSFSYSSFCSMIPSLFSLPRIIIIFCFEMTVPPLLLFQDAQTGIVDYIPSTALNDNLSNKNKPGSSGNLVSTQTKSRDQGIDVNFQTTSSINSSVQCNERDFEKSEVRSNLSSSMMLSPQALGKTLHSNGFKRWLATAEKRMSKALLANITDGLGSNIMQSYMASFLEPKEAFLSSLQDERTARSLVGKRVKGSNLVSDIKDVEIYETINSCISIGPGTSTKLQPTLFSINVTGSIIVVAYNEDIGCRLGERETASKHFAWCEHKSLLTAYSLPLHMPALMEKPITSNEISSCITAMENHPSDPNIWAIGRMDGAVMLLALHDDELGVVASISVGIPNSVSSSKIENMHYEAIQGFAFTPSSTMDPDSISLGLISVALDGLIIPWKLGEQGELVCGSAATIPLGSFHNGQRESSFGMGITDLKVSSDGKLYICQSQAGHMFELNEYQVDQLINSPSDKSYNTMATTSTTTATITTTTSLISFRYSGNGMTGNASKVTADLAWNLPTPVSRISMRVSQSMSNIYHFAVTDATGSIRIYRQGVSQATHSIVPPEPAFLVSWCHDNDRILAVATISSSDSANQTTIVYLYNFDVDLTQPWITLARTTDSVISNLSWGPSKTTSSQRLFVSVSSRILVWSIAIPCPNQRKPIPWLSDY